MSAVTLSDVFATNIGSHSALLKGWVTWPSFTPLSLFSSGEQGVFFDPSDLSTMFQDSAGTAPVTADGQPVGLILDKSKGLVLGPELVTNGTFDTDTAGWAAASGNISAVGGKLRVEVTGVGSAATYTIPVVAGKTYKFQFSQQNGTGLARMMVGPSYPNAGFVAIVDGPVTDYTCFFVPNTDTAVIQAQCNTATPGQYSEFDNISVKELAGNHASQATAAARPLYKTDGTYHWMQFDGVDDGLATATFAIAGVTGETFYGMLSNKNATVPAYLNAQINQGYWCVMQDGSVAAAHGSTMGSLITYRKNSVPIESPNRGVLYDALNNVISVLTTKSIKFGDASPATGISFGDYSGFTFAGRLYSMIVLGRAATTQEIDDTEQWVADKTGVVL